MWGWISLSRIQFWGECYKKDGKKCCTSKSVFEIGQETDINSDHLE